MREIGRRCFLKATAGTALASGWGPLPAATATPAGNRDNAPLPRRKLGRIDHEPTIVSLGGMTTVREADRREEALEIVRHAVDSGINYIDTADSYADGTSERHIGEALDDRREQVFLATKTRQRRAEPIRNQAFEASCERLRTQILDLYFLHAVHTFNDLDAALDRDGGAIKAFEHFRDAGRLRYLGISSHSSEVLSAAMDRYDFDCVFITLNPAGRAMLDPENTHAMLAKAAAKNVGVVAMKVYGGTGGRIFDNNRISAEQALRYALSHPVATATIGITRVEQIDQNIQMARNFQPYTPKQCRDLARLFENS